MTKREKAIVTAYTGILMGDFSDFHEYIEEKLDRPVWTHEFGSRSLWDEIKEASKEDFLFLCSNEDKDGARIGAKE